MFVDFSCSFFSLLFLFFSIANSLIPENEVIALEELYLHTNGENWRWKDVLTIGPKWNFTQEIVNPCCDSGRIWQGLLCSLPSPQCCIKDCHITSIQLERYGLRGDIDISWSFLQNVTELHLGQNQIRGQLPYNLTLMSSLQHLDLSVSRLSGTLPSYIGLFPKLEYLELSSCLFTGPIPSEIVYLTTLDTLRFSANSLSAFPTNIGQLQKLTKLEGYSNNFTGRLPSSIGQLTKLDYLSLYFNKFTGELPSELGSLHLITALSLDSNRFEGSILPIASLANLQTVSFQRNRFTGTIPTEFGFLTKLESLYMYQNLLTGEIPTQMASCSFLQDWFCWGNGLSGEVPSFLGSLLLLETLDFANNYFTGPITSSIHSLTNLQYFNFNRNDLSGTIPPEIGSLKSLNDLQLTVNLLSSSLPTSLSLLTLLTMLNVHDNRLNGDLPIGIGNLTNLGQLYLQGNKFTGKIHNLFSSHEKMKLTHLDLSDNLFSGEIPDTLFQLSLLSTVALTSNCFQGSIPSSICQAKKVTVLSMDGLSVAQNCVHKQTIPITNIPIGNFLNGKIPECVWNLPNLTVLSLAANGLSGTIPTSIPLHSPLINVSLSHNHLTGTIPKSFQRTSFLHLDLSNNKFHGEYSELGATANPYPESKQTLLLDINRLSGKLPTLPSNYSKDHHLNILTGNVFSCDNLPEFDVHEDTYQCGSSSLDNSVYSFLAVIGLGAIAFFIFLYFFRSSSLSNLQHLLAWTELQSTLTLFSYEDIQSYLSSLQSFQSSIIRIAQIIIGISVVSIILLLPLYLLRQSSYDATEAYSTHSHLYRWTWSTAYLTGLFPSTYLLCVWFTLATTTLIGGWLVIQQRKNLIISNQLKDESTSIKSITRRTIILGFLSVLFNTILIGAINGLYIYSTLRKESSTIHYSIQLSLAVFKWLWSIVVIPGVILFPFNSMTHKTFVRILLFLLNNVLIPSIAAMLTSPSCYRGLLIEPDEIVSGYTYQICETTAILSVDGVEYTKCVSYSSRYVEVVPLTPPFSYNYMCSSTVLTAYIPVFLYIYCLEILMPFVSYFFLQYLFPSYATLPQFFKGKFPAVFWNDFPTWLTSQLRNEPVDARFTGDQTKTYTTTSTDGSSRISRSSLLTKDPVIINAEVIFIPLMQHLSILLTFGMNSPFLAAAIAISSAILVFQFQYVTSRFLSTVNKSSGKGLILQSLSQSFVDSTSNLIIICWLILGISCLFMSALCWDIAGDQMGWKRSLFIPILGFSFYCLLIIGYFVYMKTKVQPNSNSNSNSSPGHNHSHGHGHSNQIDNQDISQLSSSSLSISPFNHPLYHLHPPPPHHQTSSPLPSPLK